MDSFRQIFLLLLFFISTSAFCQRQITGRVFDIENKKPIKEARISLLNKTETATNALGFFQITVEKTDSVFSVQAEGYIGDSFRILESNSFQINLKKINQVIAVEQIAQFPGGMGEFYKFIANTINYPREARENGISGKVVASFLINNDGSVNPDSIKIVNSLCPACDREVIRALKKSPKWIPGNIRGEPTSQWITIPVGFWTGR